MLPSLKFYSGRLAAFIALCVSVTTLPSSAEARGFFYGGVSIGAPYYYGPAYAYPAPYPYPAYYAYPAPAMTSPPPTYYQNAQQQYCREYTRPVTINGHTEQAQGQACQQPDGTWKIVN